MARHSPDSIEITRLTTENADDALTLACNVFTDASVIHAAVGVTTAEYRDYMRIPFEAMWRQGLSLIAIDRETNELIGCLIACDYGMQAQIPANVPDKLKPVSALLNKLENRYREYRSVRPRQAMLVDMAVVKPTSRGGGIYRRLRETAHQLGRDAGFKWVVGELSSRATQHLCVDSFGHKVVAEIDYASFYYMEKAPFANIKNPPSILLVEGQLN